MLVASLYLPKKVVGTGAGVTAVAAIAAAEVDSEEDVWRDGEDCWPLAEDCGGGDDSWANRYRVENNI